ncbi:hypothetical protein [Saccharicrinis aurantiacus]|uniref:hypothetical protein n=1 Tax=Saccharicrinis aurantiacus TaxID=1849719 RepID=UPI0024922AD2|nr:hypothetical protein [Saccharicrinis aurantiacus]
MNKLRLFIPMSALALGLLFTNCVDNTESEGVNAMRIAQADLIKAKAEAERLEAEANAALASANAELAQAKLQNELLEIEIKEIEKKKKQLELALAEAQNERDIEMIKAELEIEKAKQQELLILAKAAIAEAENTAARAVLEAQEKMLAAVTSLDKAIAAAKAEDRDALTLLKNEYSGFLADIVSKNNEIIGVETELAFYAIYENYNLPAQQDKKIIELNKAKLENQKEIVEKWIVDYSAIDVTNDNQELYLAARVDSVNFENTILKMEEDKALLVNKSLAAEVVMDDAKEAIDKAEEAMGEAEDLYYDAIDAKKNIDKLANNADHEDVELSDLTDENGDEFNFVEMFDYELNSHVNGIDKIYSIAYYEDKITSTAGTDDEAMYVAQKTFANSVRGFLASYWSITDRKEDFYAAKDVYIAAGDVYIEKVQLFDDANDLVDAKSAEIKLVVADKDYNNNFIAALYGTKKNVEDLIRSAKEDLIEIEEALQAIEINAIDWAAKTETKKQELFILQEELVVLEAHAATVKAEIDELLK